jgi:hypothetical protein
VNIYWGDIHNHCGITYGYGSLQNALDAAREQLDFCGVTGHAMWPDIPERNEKNAFLVDFHNEGFKKLHDNWEEVRDAISKANRTGEFITFQTYEMHSRKYGDHHVVSTDDNLPLLYADSPEQLYEKLSPYKPIIIPHHIAYTPGYRGIDWEYFNGSISPVVEIYSKHGCGISDTSAYPYLHTMGPRDSRNTAYAGIIKGHRFGFIASTDHHAGYPGSYGDGRAAVLAENKSRESIMKALRAGHTYAVTGDKIQCVFDINGKPMGSELYEAGPRHIRVDIKACDFIDKIVLFKNLSPFKVICGEDILLVNGKNTKYKVRIEMGWGRANEGYKWNGSVFIKDGILKSVEPCFRGKSVLAPSRDMKDDLDINRLNNRVLCKSNEYLEWECTTFKNSSTLHPQTNSIIMVIEGNSESSINAEINGKKTSLSVKTLLEGSHSFHMDDYNSEAVLIHRAVPEEKYTFSHDWTDIERQNECDVYHVEIRQSNGQMAWLSPVYVYNK